IDGLKIEPLDAAVSGVDPLGQRRAFRPIRDIAELREPLDGRVMAGVGGGAEYGITVRWDKNFLKLIRLLLERRSQFAMFGGVRFGGTLTIDEAFADGFDHIALCAGAGRPTVLDSPNGFARGVRAARPAEGAGYPQRPRPRRASRLGFPNGAPAHRRGEARVDRQFADPPAGGSGRRRPDGDRYRHRVAGLLRRAGRQVPHALRSARPGARHLERGGARYRAGVSGPCARAPRRKAGGAIGAAGE